MYSDVLFGRRESVFRIFDSHMRLQTSIKVCPIYKGEGIPLIRIGLDNLLRSEWNDFLETQHNDVRSTYDVQWASKGRGDDTYSGVSEGISKQSNRGNGRGLTTSREQPWQ